jgi:comEA protein
MLGFSRQEQKFVLFLLVALLVGLGLQFYMKSRPNKVPEEWAAKYENILKDFKDKTQEIEAEYNNINRDSVSTEKSHSFAAKQKFVGKININTASSEDLQTLAGIGPATASKIIEFRRSNGLFENIEALQKVRGIGPKKFEKLKPNITIE